MASRNKDLTGSVNPILTQFAVGYRNARFIGDRVAPIVESMTESGTLFSFGKEGFYLYDTERALRTNAKKIDFAVSKDTYRCAEHALESSLDYKELEAAEKYGADKVLQLQRRQINLVQRALTVEHEKAVADIVFSGTYYATGNKTTLSGTSQWSDKTNSAPFTDIKTGIAAARADLGVRPNTMVLGFDAFHELTDHPDVLERIKYSERAVVTEDILANVFGMANVLVGESVYSTDAGVFTDLWSDSCALIYLPTGQGEEVEGTSVHTVTIAEVGYPEVKTYQEKNVESYRTTRKYQVKNINTSFGYLILDVKA